MIFSAPSQTRIYIFILLAERCVRDYAPGDGAEKIMSLRMRPLTSSNGALSEHGPWVRCGQSFTFFRHQKTHIFSDGPAAFHLLLMLRTKLLDQRFTQIVIRYKVPEIKNASHLPNSMSLESDLHFLFLRTRSVL